MNISYNWLKEYVDFDLTPEEVAAALTSIGLETGGVEEVQTIKGGLEGLVIGEVLTCVPHPNSDHMHVTLSLIHILTCRFFTVAILVARNGWRRVNLNLISV